MLSSLQQRLAKLFFSLPEAVNFALAGGAALIFWRAVQRETHDLDFFGIVPEEIPLVAERFQEAMRHEGLEFSVIRSSPGFVRMVVTEPGSGQQVVVDIGYDHRLCEPIKSPIGRVLDLKELAADKLLALFGRAEPRDFVDVFHLSQRFGIEAMLDWAKEKDSGFDRHVLATMLARFELFPRTEFPVDDSKYEEMKRFFQQLQANLIDDCFHDTGREGR